METYHEFTATAGLLARQVGGLLRHYFTEGVTVEHKDQLELVTTADQTSEAFLVREIQARYPSHALLGEETGFHPGHSDYAWVVDPLDGTQNFACGVPLFGVCIALLHRGIPRVGAIFLPMLDRLYIGQENEASTLNGVPLQARTQPLDGNSIIGIQSNYRQEHYPPFIELIHTTYSARVLGSAAIHTSFVAEGVFAAATDSKCRLWDIAAGAVILAGAGARFAGRDGRPVFPITDDLAEYRHRRIPWFAAGEDYFDSLRKQLFETA